MSKPRFDPVTFQFYYRHPGSEGGAEPLRQIYWTLTTARLARADASIVRSSEF
jgi:hypothetical protein